MSDKKDRLTASQLAIIDADVRARRRACQNLGVPFAEVWGSTDADIQQYRKQVLEIARIEEVTGETEMEERALRHFMVTGRDYKDHYTGEVGR